jgi:hypothetical protein
MPDSTEYYFKRFKIAVITVYSFLFCGYLIDLFEGNARNIILMTWSLCLTISAGFFWYYLWICAKLLGKKPLHYVFLSIFIPIFGGVAAYLMLKKAYTSFSPITKSEIQ